MTRRQIIEAYVPYPISYYAIQNAEREILSGVEERGFLDSVPDGEWGTDEAGDYKIHRILSQTFFIQLAIEGADFWNKTSHFYLTKNL